MFLGGTERDQWHEMVQSNLLFLLLTLDLWQPAAL